MWERIVPGRVGGTGRVRDVGTRWLSRGAAGKVANSHTATPIDTVRQLPASGPRAPQAAVPVPDAVDRLPRRVVTAPAPVWWVGVHGGSAESTLARLLPGSRATGHAWPQLASDREAGPLPVVLTARSSLRGLTAAQRAATEWAAGTVPGVELLGLAIVADAPGKLPRPLRDLAALVAGGVPRTWHLPWIEAWRLGEVDEASAPKDVRRLLADVRALLPSAPPHPAAPHEKRYPS